MKYLKGILIAILATSVSAKCGPGYGSCSNGKCCSKYGHCGTTDSHCGAGCQVGFGICNSSGSVVTTTSGSSLPTSTSGKCGKNDGVCPSGKCCSKYGYCGTSASHCGTGCQSEFGTCNGNTSSTTTSTKETTTTTKINNGSLPTSTNGKCGSTDGICPSGKCCSKYGYCGTSTSYCGSGCQSEFGICSGTTASTTTITKTTTTTINKTTTTTAGNESLPTSTNGKCGKTVGICPNHQCCSKYGYCGTSDTHCSVDSGCQSKFGRCGEYVSDIKFKYYYQCKDPKHWALSYDDGPYKYDLELLDLLKKKNVKATFFLNGANVMDITSSKGKEIVQRMYNEGHVIGSHTWSHSNLNKLDKEGIISEMTKLEDVLYKYIGKKPALMRPPYGAGHDSEEIASILDGLGYNAACMWNVDTLDWDKTGDINYALSEFKKYLGKPIMSLNHCFYEGITKDTLLKLTEAEINFMEEQGYTAVTMDVCLGLDAYQK